MSHITNPSKDMAMTVGNVGIDVETRALLKRGYCKVEVG
jgi:hypothetical protein